VRKHHDKARDTASRDRHRGGTAPCGVRRAGRRRAAGL